MEAVTLEDLNESFQFHRTTCPKCGTSGPGVCAIGLELLTMFHQVIIEAILQDVKHERTMA